MLPSLEPFHSFLILSEVAENRVNAQNPYYLSLRNGATEAREKAFKSRENRRVAFIDGTSGYLTARELHHDFKNYMDAARRMDDKASDWIFHENNKFTRYGRVDLHSLKAHEAAVHTRRKLIEAKKEGVRQVTFIVGRALDKHSLRPLKVELNRVVKNLDFRSVVDPTNPGLLVVFTNNKDDNYIDRDAMEAPQRPEAE
ncbi:hypothetical protein C8J56DRAFT_1117379 [Mycena floridula]|nr:hypothetical protein C8J56DRAFT_1117379 [Mycena floridula]